MKIDSNEANDSVFLLLCFYLMVQERFKNPLLRLRSGDKEACVLLSISKPSSDEEYQTKDSGAGKKHRRTHHCLQKKN